MHWRGLLSEPDGTPTPAALSLLGLAVGGGAGLIISMFVVGFGGLPPAALVVIMAAIGAAVMYAWARYVMRGADAVVGRIYGGGRATPQPTYSLAESLVVRGQWEAAAATYEALCSEFPADPEPPKRLARLLRDDMARPADAVRWLRAARDRAEPGSGLEKALTREISETLLRIPGPPKT